MAQDVLAFRVQSTEVLGIFVKLHSAVGSEVLMDKLPCFAVGQEVLRMRIIIVRLLHKLYRYVGKNYMNGEGGSRLASHVSISSSY